MTTVLELGLFQYFSKIFPLILVFVVVYAILAKTKILGESKAVSAMIAALATFITALFEDFLLLINLMAPWFVLIFVFLLLLLMLYRFMGISEKTLIEYITTDKTVKWALFIVGLAIFFGSVATLWGEELLAAGVEENVTFTSEVVRTIFNTKVLGLILVAALAMFTVLFLTSEKI